LKRARRAALTALFLGLLGAVAVTLWAGLAPPSETASTTRPAPSVSAAIPKPRVSSEPAEEAPIVHHALIGTVRTPAGEPIRNATVRVVYDGRETKIAQTDRNGAFLLTRLPRQLDRVEFSARGYAPESHSTPLLPPQRRVRWDVVLEPADGVFGVVVAGRFPAVEAFVTIRRPGDRRFLAKTRADLSGRFALDWPEGDGPFELRAFHGEHGRAATTVEAPGEVTIELPGGGYIMGRVVQVGGDPVESFAVTATPLMAEMGGPPAQSFEDPEGRFSLGPLAPGRIRLWAAASGFRPRHSRVVTLAAGETLEGVILEMEPSAALTGRVTNARTGNPIEGAFVKPAEWRSRALAEGVAAYTNAQGRYRLTALPGQRTSFTVEAEGYRKALVGGVEGKSDGELVRDFALTPEYGDDRAVSELTGIGAVLGRTREGVRVARLLEDGPAGEVLDEGDVIVMVNGMSARGRLRQTVEAIRGEVGTEVVLWVKRGGKGVAERVVVTRDRVAFKRRQHN